MLPFSRGRVLRHARSGGQSFTAMLQRPALHGTVLVLHGQSLRSLSQCFVSGQASSTGSSLSAWETPTPGARHTSSVSPNTPLPSGYRPVLWSATCSTSRKVSYRLSCHLDWYLYEGGNVQGLDAAGRADLYLRYLSHGTIPKMGVFQECRQNVCDVAFQSLIAIV